MPLRRFPKSMRLLKPSQFEHVFAAKTSVADARLIAYGATNDLGHARLGLTASRKLGGAVQRNRWKRLTREAFRLTADQLPGLDLICLPKSPTPPSLSELLESLPALAARLEQQLRRKRARLAKESP